jgi:hypothetical protein
MPRNNTKKRYHKNKKRVYTKKHFKSGDGMLTAVWGPSLWHYLHTMSFNYPIHPTESEKTHYKEFILSLQHVLPCKYCRDNLKKNFKAHPLKNCNMKNRETYSKYVYKLHEIVNKMLGKKSGLSYCDVRERYEHFRARCTAEKPKKFKFRKNKTKKEKGCTEPLYGKKSKCVIKIVPQDEKCETMQINKKCLKTTE